MCIQDQVLAVSVEDLKTVTELALLTGRSYGVQEYSTDATDVDFALTNLTPLQFECFMRILDKMDIYYETQGGLVASK